MKFIRGKCQVLYLGVTNSRSPCMLGPSGKEKPALKEIVPPDSTFSMSQQCILVAMKANSILKLLKRTTSRWREEPFTSTEN